MEKEIFIIRHGETDFNQLGIVQGKGVNSSINAKGTQQAQAFFEAYSNETFEKIYITKIKCYVLLNYVSLAFVFWAW